MAVTYKDLFDTHIKYVEFLLSRTYILNQYLSDIKNTGGEVEIEVREFISHFIPKRFKITHGFICFANDNVSEPVVSPQLDCIIVDTLVPHSIFPLSNSTGQEVVPLEAVVGIIEIKRTLNAKSLESAIDHLTKTVQVLGIDKTSQQNYLPSGLSTDVLTTGIYSNPLIAILAVNHEVDNVDFLKKNGAVFNNLAKDCNTTLIDIIGSFSGFLFCTMDSKEVGTDFKPYPFREKEKFYTYGLCTEETVSHAGLISRILGFIVAYLSTASGKFNPMDKYFFHRSTWLK